MNGNTGCWVGIDVAKSTLDAALLDERGKLKNHVFNNNTKGQVRRKPCRFDRAVDIQ